MSFFTKRYEDWGFEGTYEYVPKKYLRVNTLRTRNLPPRFKLKKIEGIPFCYLTEADFSLPSSPEYLLGEFYIQDSSTQLAAMVLNPKETDHVLDVAAAPGGKTTHLAALMNNKGLIVSVDPNAQRLERLSNALERLGVTNAFVLQKDGQYVSDLKMEFDKVLLDVPCSGNFSIDPEWFSKRDLEGIKTNARLQRKLLAAGVDVCKSGGDILYCTCSLEREEDEDVIEWALQELPVELVPIDMQYGVPGITPKTRLCKRIWPGEMQGFFMAKLRKK